MDNGNYPPIYHQLSGNNYIPPNYLPQAQQIQQLDYNYPNAVNDYPNIYTQFHQSNPVQLAAVPSATVLAQNERLLSISKHSIVSGQHQLPPIAHNVQLRSQIERIPNNTAWIKQEGTPSTANVFAANRSVEAEKSEIAAQHSENTKTPSFSQAFTEAVLNKELKEQFVKKPNSKPRRKRREDSPPKPRTRNPETWKRNKLRLARLRGEQYESKSVVGLCEVTGKTIFTQQAREARRLKPPCKKHRNTLFQCQKFTDEMRQAIFDNFWQNLDWEQRKLLVGEHVKVEAVKTTCAKDEKQQRRFVNIKHYLDFNGEPQLVCKHLFHGTFGINPHATHYWLISLNKIEMDRTERHNKSVCLAKLVSDAEKPAKRRLKRRERERLKMLEAKDGGADGSETGSNSQGTTDKPNSPSTSQQNSKRFSKQQNEIGPPCNCRSSMIFTKDCSNFTDEIRKNIFYDFWESKDFEGRKSFFLGNVNLLEPFDQKRGLLEYFLPINGVRHPVCQILFLSTLGIGRYSCRFWLTLVGILPQFENKSNSDNNDLKTETQTRETVSNTKDSGEDLMKKNPMRVRCKCLDHSSQRHCQRFTENIRKRIHRDFWCTFNVLARKEFLCKYVEVESAEIRTSDSVSPNGRKWSYHLPLGAERLSVCHSLFSSTLGYTKSCLRKRLMHAMNLRPIKRGLNFVPVDIQSDADLLDEEEMVDAEQLQYENRDTSLKSDFVTETDDEVDYLSNVKVEVFTESESEIELVPQPKRKKTVCDYLSELINQISRPVLRLREINLDDFSHLANYSEIQQQYEHYKNTRSECVEDEIEDESAIEPAFIDVNQIKKEINNDN